MREVQRLRMTRQPRWSAGRLAEEMTKAGVPWSRDTVVNLENGRRKRIAAHELLTLAYVLDVASPAELLAPASDRYFRAIPDRPFYRKVAAAWIEGKTGPLRQVKAWGPEAVADAAEELAGNLPPGFEDLTPDDVAGMFKAILERQKRDDSAEDRS
jgi:hypothetical protein